MGANNVKYIGSANIVQFGFQATFDLDQKKIHFDISEDTIFQEGMIGNVPGVCFLITGPGGLPILTPDFTAPAIVPSAGSTYDIDLPGDYNLFGFYSIQGQIKDEDGTIYSTLLITKEICKPEGYNNNYVPGSVSIQPDLGVPQILISETTNLTYKGNAPATISKTGTLSFPAATLSDLSITYTPIMITAGSVLTGRYTVNLKTLATYDQQDGILVTVPYVTRSAEFVISPGTALAQIVCQLNDVQKTIDMNPMSVPGRAAKEKLDKSAPFVLQALVNEKAGRSSDEQIARIKDILGCDISTSALVEGVPVLGNGGASIAYINVVGSNAATVTAATNGGTKTYTANVKYIIVQKQDDDDDTFEITRTDSGTQTIFSFAFNDAALAQSILLQIQDSQDLTDLLNSLISGATAAVSFDGFAGGCVITIGNCSYALSMASTPSKIATSINIANTAYNAPSGLNITSASGMQTWLNSLNLGTFTVTYDSGAGTVLIQSTANAHVVNQFTYSQNSNPVTVQFTKTCAGLVAILNAIITYLCAIDSTKVAFGLTGKTFQTFNSGGQPQTISLDPTLKVSDVLSALLTANTAMVTKIMQVALTCANIQALFGVSAATIANTDYVLGTKQGQCAQWSLSDLANAILGAINNNPGIKATLCSLVSSCSAPTYNPDVVVSATYASGNTCAPITGITGSVA